MISSITDTSSWNPPSYPYSRNAKIICIVIGILLGSSLVLVGSLAFNQNLSLDTASAVYLCIFGPIIPFVSLFLTSTIPYNVLKHGIFNVKKHNNKMKQVHIENLRFQLKNSGHGQTGAVAGYENSGLPMDETNKSLLKIQGNFSGDKEAYIRYADNFCNGLNRAIDKCSTKNWPIWINISKQSLRKLNDSIMHNRITINLINRT